MALEANVKEKPDTGTSATQEGAQPLAGGPGSKGAASAQADKSAAQARQAPKPNGEDKASAAAEERKPTSLLEGKEDGDDEGADERSAPADWPEDWREKAVSDIADEKARAKEIKRLSRFKSPADVYKSWRAMEQKLADDYEPKYSDDWDDEKKAEYRKAKGIPDKADDYTIPDIDGHQWTEADHPVLKSLFDDMHAGAVPQQTVDEILGWYAKFQQQAEEQTYELDESDRANREDELRSEWGPEFKQHRARVKQLLTETDPDRIAAPKGLLEALDRARFNGHRLINLPGVMEWLSQVALATYGNNAMTKGQAASVASRKAEIEKIMDADFAKYKREGLDKEYADILEREARAR